MVEEVAGSPELTLHYNLEPGESQIRVRDTLWRSETCALPLAWWSATRSSGPYSRWCRRCLLTFLKALAVVEMI